MWLGGLLFDEILRFLDEQQPDILLLQEVYNGEDSSLDRQYRSIHTLQEKFHFRAQDFAPTYLEKLPFGKLERGNAILSKFPIIDRNEWWLHDQYREYEDLPENYATSPRNLQHVVVRTPNAELNVYNLQGVWDLRGDNDSEARLHMSQVIVDAIQGKSNVILGGDTNAQRHTKTIANIEQHLTNVFGDELVSSFNMRRKTNPGYATAVVDMLFVSPNIQVLEHECPDIDISDHLPLVATFVVNET